MAKYEITHRKDNEVVTESMWDRDSLLSMWLYGFLMGVIFVAIVAPSLVYS